MNDFILFLAFLLVGYLCSGVFVVTMVRVFFPLKTKEEWAKVDAARMVSSQQRSVRIRNVSQAMMNKSGQLA